ncbi:hypothetical protein ACP4OV_026281 [Aristida adscensionis]
MYSCEGSRPVAQSRVARAKPAVMVDCKIEPAGEGLPDGWLKECRPRKNRNGSSVNDDVFYIDPVHGYEFSSLLDAYRYLESGNISQSVMLPRKRKTEDLYVAGDRSYHTGRQSGYTQLDNADESNQYGQPTIGGTRPWRDALPNPENPNNAGNMTISEPEGINLTQTEVDRLEASKGKSVQSVSNRHTREEVQSVTGKETSVDQKPKEKKRRTKPVKPIATPLRSSPRLAALKISQEAINAPKDVSFSTKTDITNQLEPKQVKNSRRKTNSSVLPEKKHEASTANSSEKVGSNHPSVVSQIQGASVPCSSADVCQNAPAEAPILAQEVGLGKTADYTAGSTLSSLFRHVWSDPCLEFAFRMLTSDIPVLDGPLAVSNSFLPPQNMNKGATPNCSSSAYDGTRNHAQVDHGGMSMPRPSDPFCSSGWFPPQ